MPTDNARTEVLVIRLSEAERQMLARIAMSRGLTMSDVLRLEIRRQFSELAKGDRRR